MERKTIEERLHWFFFYTGCRAFLYLALFIYVVKLLIGLRRCPAMRASWWKRVKACYQRDVAIRVIRDELKPYRESLTIDEE